MVEVILLNLMSQALWEFALSPLAAAGAGLVGAVEATPEASPFAEVAALAARKLADVVGTRIDEPGLEQVLGAPEVRELVRELFVFDAGAQPDAVRSARAAFTLYWERTLPHAQLADAVFDVVLQAADQVLAKAAAEGNVLAHDTRSAFRQRLILDHIRAVERKVELLTAQELSVADIDAFENDYRAEVAERSGSITPPDFYSATRVPIDELYVVPALSDSGRDGGEPDGVAYTAWLDRIDRCVVLGNPGGGKSTLARKLCYDLARDKGGALLGGRRITPAIITLKDYGADKKAHGHSITEYLEVRARSSYQMTVPDGVIEYLLSMGRMLVIFDGLDELLDTTYRQEIRSDVESFSRRYPALPIVVTSREVGYDQAPLAPEAFALIRIAEFDDERVKSYAEKWFHLDSELSESEQVAKAAAFVEESQVVPDLRGNPLLLALMCKLYGGQNYIPRNRPEVYESCARMLFEVWDKSRGIEAVLPIAEHLRPTMQYLANWIYSDDSLRNGVTREQLIDKSAEFLMRWRFEDPHLARHAAAQFVEFCRGRAWVFSDLGSTEEGVDLFQFTHRTFLEYFTAAYLVSSHGSTGELVDELAPHIAKEEWDVVAQVAFQLRSRNLIGAADELLGNLIARANAAELGERLNYLSFATRSLGYLVPTPQAIRAVVSGAVGCVIELLGRSDADSPHAEFRGFEQRLRPGPLLRALAGNASEVKEAVAAALTTSLDEALAGETATAARAGRVILALRGFGSESAAAGIGELYHARQERIRTLVERDVFLAMDATGGGLMNIRDLLERFGPRPVFEMRLSLLGDGWYWPIAATAARAVTVEASPTSSARVGAAMDEVKAIGDYVKTADLPWIEDYGVMFRPTPWDGPGDGGVTEEPALDEDSRLGLFAIGATILERLREGAPEAREAAVGALAPIQESSVGIWKMLAGVAVQRATGEPAVSPVEEYFAPGRGRDLVAAWAQGEISFVGEGGDGSRPTGSD